MRSLTYSVRCAFCAARFKQTFFKDHNGPWPFPVMCEACGSCPVDYARDGKPRDVGPAPHWREMREIASAAQWPERFSRDFTEHDLKALAGRDPRLPFAWCLGRGGTHLIFSDRFNLQSLRTFGASLQEAIGNDSPVRWFWWDGVALLEIRDGWEGICERFDRERERARDANQG